MKPIIAIIGRQNVGKSTLFNELTNTKDALVTKFSGLTRDRKYGTLKFKDYEFTIIDTGGLENLNNEIETYINFQTSLAIKQANIIFFIVDGRSGLMPEDYKIAKKIYNKNNNYLIVNKIDGLDINEILNDFYKLGIKNIYPIAASQRIGINELIEKVIFDYIYKKTTNYTKSLKIMNHINSYTNNKKEILNYNKIDNFQSNLLPIKLAIIGRPNVGKSTLTNSILRENRVIVYDKPFTTRDSIYIPRKLYGYPYIIIDTAGIRKNKKITGIIEKFSVTKTLKSIKDSNIILYIIDAKEGILYQDLSLLNYIINIGHSIVIAINKWDLIPQKDYKTIKNMLNLKLNFINFIKIHFISALNSNGIDDLFKTIYKTYISSKKQLSAKLLTNIIKMAEKEHQTPIIKGRRIKMKYAHSIGYNPLTIIIHGNNVTKLNNSYKRYLINYFHRILHITGIIIHIYFKEGINPYKANKNKLKLTKLHKHKKLNITLKNKK